MSGLKLAVLVLWATLGTVQGEMQLIMLPAEQYNATCTDGSPVGYYFEPSTSGQRTKYVMWLKGGSACWNYEDCVSRKTEDNHDGAGALGSSKNWAKNYTGVAIQDTNSAVNPDFFDYNMIYVEYCSGDQWRGTQLEQMNPWGGEGNETFAFAGHLHMRQVVHHVLEGGGIIPTDFILTGGSAGGVGAFVNADWFASHLPASTKFAALPLAGFGNTLHAHNMHWKFWSTNTTDTDPLEHSFFGWMANISLYDIPAVAKCVADPGVAPVPWPERGGYYPKTFVCFMAGVFYPYTTASIHVSQCSVDREQVFDQGGAPKGEVFTNPEVAAYLQFARKSETGGIQRVVIGGPKNATDGLFSPACLGHVNETGWFGPNSAQSQHVDGKSHAQAFSDWYFGREGNHMHLNDSDNLNQLCSCSHTATPQSVGVCGRNPTCAEQLKEDGCLPASRAYSRRLLPVVLEEGPPNACEQCAEQHKADIAAAGCTTAAVKQLCE
jgi:hypothetical protein